MMSLLLITILLFFINKSISTNADCPMISISFEEPYVPLDQCQNTECLGNECESWGYFCVNNGTRVEYREYYNSDCTGNDYTVLYTENGEEEDEDIDCNCNTQGSIEYDCDISTLIQTDCNEIPPSNNSYSRIVNYCSFGEDGNYSSIEYTCTDQIFYYSYYDNSDCQDEAYYVYVYGTDEEELEDACSFCDVCIYISIYFNIFIY